MCIFVNRGLNTKRRSRAAPRRGGGGWVHHGLLHAQYESRERQSGDHRIYPGAGAAAGQANVLPIGAITKGSEGKELAEIGDLRRAGCVAISDDGKPVMNSLVMRRAMEYALAFDIPVVDHCEDLHLAEGGCMNEGVDFH